MQSRYLGGAPLKGGMWFGLKTYSQKNTPAAMKKMVFLTTGGAPGGTGKGREVCLWGILMGLSLAVCRTFFLHTETPLCAGEQSPMDECSRCTQIVLDGQGGGGSQHAKPWKTVLWSKAGIA